MVSCQTRTKNLECPRSSKKNSQIRGHHTRFLTKCPRVESDKKKKSLREKSEELRCPYCDIIQSNKSSLSYHITTIHYPQNLDSYEKTDQSVNLKQRKTSVEGIEVVTIDEIDSPEISNKKSNEDLSFKSDKSLVETDFSVANSNSNSKSEELRCPYCDKIQTNKSSLSYHISTVHYFQNPFLNENTNLSVKKKQIENKEEDIPKQVCRNKDLDSKVAQKEHSNEITKTDQEMIEGGASKLRPGSPSKGHEISEENTLSGWSTPATTPSSPNDSQNNSPRGGYRVWGRPRGSRGSSGAPLGSPKQQNESKSKNETETINRVKIPIKRALKNWQLVVLAIKNSPDGLVNTDDLYNFCVENFSDCSTLQPNFKNSMRHTLWKKFAQFPSDEGNNKYGMPLNQGDLLRGIDNYSVATLKAVRQLLATSCSKVWTF